MANEIQTSTTFTFSKNGSPPQNWSVSGSINVTGNYFVTGIQSIGLVDETIALGDIATIGYVLLKNLDATHFVSFGVDGSTYPNRLLAGEECKVRLNGAAIHLIADTAACKVSYLIVEA